MCRTLAAACFCAFAFASASAATIPHVAPAAAIGLRRREVGSGGEADPNPVTAVRRRRQQLRQLDTISNDVPEFNAYQHVTWRRYAYFAEIEVSATPPATTRADVGKYQLILDTGSSTAMIAGYHCCKEMDHADHYVESDVHFQPSFAQGRAASHPPSCMAMRYGKGAYQGFLAARAGVVGPVQWRIESEWNDASNVHHDEVFPNRTTPAHFALAVVTHEVQSGWLLGQQGILGMAYPALAFRATLGGACTAPSAARLGHANCPVGSPGACRTHAPEPFFDSLVAHKDLGVHNIFSIQMCDARGYLGLGGFDPDHFSGALVVNDLVGINEQVGAARGFYNVRVTGVSVGGGSVFSNTDASFTSNKMTAVLDTGTSKAFMATRDLGTAIRTALVAPLAKIARAYPANQFLIKSARGECTKVGSGLSAEGFASCFARGEALLCATEDGGSAQDDLLYAAIADGLPDIAFELNNGAVRVKPHDYIITFVAGDDGINDKDSVAGNEGRWCFEAFYSVSNRPYDYTSSAPQVILGNRAMEQYYWVFDRRSEPHRVGFAPSQKCGSMPRSRAYGGGEKVHTDIAASGTNRGFARSSCPGEGCHPITKGWKPTDKRTTLIIAVSAAGAVVLAGAAYFYFIQRRAPAPSSQESAETRQKRLPRLQSGRIRADGAAPGPLAVGTRVSALWTDGEFYDGVVVKQNDDKTYRVAFDDGDVADRVGASNIRGAATFL